MAKTNDLIFFTFLFYYFCIEQDVALVQEIRNRQARHCSPQHATKPFNLFLLSRTMQINDHQE